MVRRRAGWTSLGCILVMVIVGALGYFAFTIGRVYWRYYQYKDAMAQEGKFASHNDDSVIVAHLRARADSLGLPEAAKRVHIRRRPGVIYIWSEYYETVELPGFVKDIEFVPEIEKPL
jgi:hypothetical protein